MTYSFDATYDPGQVARAEKAFYLYSITKLRPLMTFAPPVVLAAFVAIAAASGASRWYVAILAAAFVLSATGPVFFYFARARAAASLATEFPVRRVQFTDEELEITMGSNSMKLPWQRVTSVWEAKEHVFAVLGKFGAISIPRRCVPDEAHAFMLRAVVACAP